MSEKSFCESGKHIYKEVDVVKSIFAGDEFGSVSIVVACSKCDSKFLRLVLKPIP